MKNINSDNFFKKQIVSVFDVKNKNVFLKADRALNKWNLLFPTNQPHPIKIEGLSTTFVFLKIIF